MLKFPLKIFSFLLVVAVPLSEECKTSPRLVTITTTTPSPFLGPQYLTVQSKGEAGRAQYARMGVYHLTGDYNNQKPVWSRHDGSKKLFYDNG